MIALLNEFKYVFAWQTSDMSDISTNIISHELKADLTIQWITHKRRVVGLDNRLKGKKEVGKLLDACFVKEIVY